MKNKTSRLKDEKVGTGVLKKILKSLKPIEKGLITASCFSALSVIVSMFTPKLSGYVIDELNSFWLNKADGAVLNMPYIQKLSLIMSALFALIFAASVAKMYIMNHTVSLHFTATTRIRLSEKLMKLPVKYVDTTTNGEFIARMTNDVSTMGGTIHDVIDLAVQGAIQLVFITVMMVLINPLMALIVLTVVPVSVTLSTIAAKKSEKYWDDMHKKNGEMSGLVEETYANIMLVKAYNGENAKFAQHAAIAAELEVSYKKAGFYSQIVSPIIAFTNKIAYVLICLIGGYYAIKGTITVGGVTAIILYAQMLAAPLSSIANGLSMFQHTVAATKRVYDIMDLPEMTEADGADEFSGEGDVEFKNVYFGYESDAPLIKDLSSSVKAGQKVAIVGPTGAGKTTLVNLLMRFYDADKGGIFVDGLNIYGVPRDKLREQFAMVLQDTWLFKGTVFENVAYAKEGATPEEVRAACAASYCDRFIRTLPDGYDTVIDDETTNLSGGQKQLLTIARAILADKKMLILDEATSSVDTRTEILIQKALKKLMAGRTSFVIAHRLSTIVDADLILVIDDGDIVEKGTHKDLLEQNGLYSQIYNSQYNLLQM